MRRECVSRMVRTRSERHSGRRGKVYWAPLGRRKSITAVQRSMARQEHNTRQSRLAVTFVVVVVVALLVDGVRSFVIPAVSTTARPSSLLPSSSAAAHAASQATCSRTRFQTGALSMSSSSGGGGSSDAPPTRAPATERRLEPAPSTFEQCIRQAQAAVEEAFKDGLTLVEVEFPPLQQDYLEDSGSSAYDVSSANVRLASRFAQSFAAEGKEVSILLPDEAEMERAVEDEGGEEISPGVTLRTLRTSGRRTAQSLDALFWSFVGRGTGVIEPIEGTDIYVAIVYSCQELPDLQELHKLAPEAKIVCFNLRLDTLRGDLGLPAFPPKTLHYNFLSKIKPVYLLRTRAYSRTISKKPFLVNYQGAQFRVYPGVYQCLLDVGSRYKRVQSMAQRQTLGDFKDTLTNALQLDEEKDNAVTSFFRKGFKNRTWWEEESEEEMSDNWRT